MILSIYRTGVYILTDLQTDGNIGFGVAPSALYKCNIAGSINSTSLYQSGTLIDFSSYATNANLTTNYTNTTNMNTAISNSQTISSNYTISTSNFITNKY